MENPTLPTNWLASKNSKDYGEPDITYQLAGSDKLGIEGNTLPDVFYRKQIDVEPSNIQFPMSP